MADVTLRGQHEGEQVVGGVAFVDGVAHDVNLSPNQRIYFERMGARIREPKTPKTTEQQGEQAGDESAEDAESDPKE